MKSCAFNGITGAFWSDQPETVIDATAVVVDVPENIAAWRLSIVPETQEVVIKYPGSSDIDAERLLDADVKAAAAAAAEKAKQDELDRAAAFEAAQAAAAVEEPAAEPQPEAGVNGAA